jgi:hypothetical protein
VVSANPDDYKAATSQPYRSVLGGTLAACALGCAFHIHNWTLNHGDLPTGYFFEAGDPGLEHVINLMNSLVGGPAATNPFSIAVVGSAGKSTFPELQAADFLSHAKSTGDRMWLNRWKQQLNVVDETLTFRRLQETSESITRMIKQRRSERRAESRRNRVE